MDVEVVTQAHRTTKLWCFLSVLFVAAAVSMLCAMGAGLYIYWKDVTLTYRTLSSRKGEMLTTDAMLQNISLAPYGGPNFMNSSRMVSCEDTLCISGVRNMLSKLNNTVGPCEDFYKFVCSAAWYDSNDSYQWPFRYKALGHIYSAIDKYIEDYTQAHRMISGSTSALAKTIVFYLNCTSPDGRALTLPDHMAAVMTRFGLQGFPYIRRQVEGSSVQYVAALMAKELRIFPILEVAIAPRRGVNITATRTVLLHHLPRWSYVSLELDRSYHALRKSASLLPAIQHFSRQHFQEVQNFSRLLSSARQCRERNNQTQKPASLSGFSGYTKFSLTEFLNVFFNDVRDLELKSLVVVSTEACIHGLLGFIEKWENTNVILNYLGAYLWIYLSPLFPSRGKDDDDLPTTPYCAHGIPARWPLCLQMAEHICPPGAIALITKTFGQSNNADDLSLQHQWWVDDLKEVVLSYIEHATWLEEDRRETLKTQIRDLQILPIIPDIYFRRTDNVDSWTCAHREDFSSLPPVLHFLEAMATLRRQYWQQLLFGDRRHVFRHTYVENFAFEMHYSHAGNKLHIPLAYFGEILSAPAVWSKVNIVKVLPDVLKEITKLLLRHGTYTVKHVSAPQLWNNRTLETLDNMASCLAGQISRREVLRASNYTEDTADVRSVLSDALANQLVIEPYLDLYKRIIEHSNSVTHDKTFVDERVSSYTLRQLAFICYAESLCMMDTGIPPDEEYMRTRRLSAANRVRLSLASTTEFSAAFHCNHEDLMYSDKPCNVREARARNKNQ